MINKFFFCCLFFVILCSCQSLNFTNEKQVYKYRLADEFYNESLILFYTGEFDYNGRGGLLQQSSAGKWLKTEDKIILNSNEEYKSGIILSKESADTTSNIRIRILDVDKEPIVGVVIITDDQKALGVITNYEGIAYTEFKSIRDITINYLGDEYKYMVKDNKSNYFVFTLKPDNLSHKCFENEKFTIRRNKLIDSDGNVFKRVN